MSARETAAKAGYKATSDPDKFRNGNSTFTDRAGKGFIIDNGGRNNSYGRNTSDSFLAKRLKK